MFVCVMFVVGQTVGLLVVSIFIISSGIKSSCHCCVFVRFLQRLCRELHPRALPRHRCGEVFKAPGSPKCNSQSGSGGLCVGVAIGGGSWNSRNAISSVLVGIDSFSTY